MNDHEAEKELNTSGRSGGSVSSFASFNNVTEEDCSSRDISPQVFDSNIVVDSIVGHTWTELEEV